MAGQISPDSYVSSPWVYEQRAYNEGYVPTPTSCTYCNKQQSVWSEWLELYWSDGKQRLCSKIEVWARTEYTVSDYLDVDVYYNGAWHDAIYTGVFQAQWKAGTFDTVLIERIRIRLKCGGGSVSEYRWLRVYEVVLYEEDPVAPGYGNCIGLWRMNDNKPDTVVKDKSCNQLDGIAPRNTEDMHVEEGKLLGALNLNGSEYINVPENSVLNPGGALTVVFWFRTSVTGQQRSSFFIRDKSNYKYTMDSGMGTECLGSLAFLVRTDAGTQIVWGITGVDDYWADGQWHMVICIFERGVVKGQKIYVDTVLYNAADAPDGDISEGDEGLRIGDSMFSDNEWVGDIDFFALFNKVLSDAEFTFLWNGGNGREYLGTARSLVGGSLATSRKGLV